MNNNYYYTGLGIAKIDKDDYKTIFGYYRGDVVFKGTASEYCIFIDKGIQHTKEVFYDDIGYSKAVQNYQKERSDRRKEFKKDLFAENKKLIQQVTNKFDNEAKIEECYKFASDISTVIGDGDEFEITQDYFERLLILIS